MTAIEVIISYALAFLLWSVGCLGRSAGSGSSAFLQPFKEVNEEDFINRTVTGNEWICQPDPENEPVTTVAFEEI